VHLYRDQRNIDYIIVFMISRVAFAFIPSLLWDAPFFQLQVIILMITIYIKFYCSIRPHEVPMRGYLETFYLIIVMLQSC
jgi:hypothetical protein